MPANILIVEDEWLIAEDYASVLRGAGHSIVGPCATVETALSTIKENPVELALLDMELIGETSFPVAQCLRERNIPFAFLSGHGMRDLPPAMRDQQILPKPIEHAALLAAVEQLSATD